MPWRKDAASMATGAFRVATCAAMADEAHIASDRRATVFSFLMRFGSFASGSTPVEHLGHIFVNREADKGMLDGGAITANAVPTMTTHDA
jgi:hypothetical protein